MKKHFVSAVLAALLCVFCSIGTRAQTAPLAGRGQEWLAWSPSQRRGFVAAYMDGYLRGKSDACEAAAELFAPGKSVVNLDDMPDRQCFRHAKSYSRPAGDYAKLITSFYEKHPVYRDIPVEYFLLLFTDNRYSTLAAIEQGIRKGDVRTIF